MRIIIATGGTGGHVFPALQVAKVLQRQHDILFLSSGGVAAQIIEQNGFDLIFLSAEGVRFKSLKLFLRSIFLIFKATRESLRFLSDFKPDVVVGFGGYGGFPVLLAAFLLRYPTLIHEQNVIPGKANRILSRFVNKIAISFLDTLRYFPKGKSLFTGCPSRLPIPSLDKNQLYAKFGFEATKPVILVLGGSQGSHRINAEFVEAAKSLKKEFDFQVIHITGPKDFDEFKDQYVGLGIKAHVFGFLNEMEEVYAISDLVIGRAGAVTVTELAVFQIPSILIPYPYAGGHQKWNAKVLQDAKVSRLLEESELVPGKLQTTIQEIMKQGLTKQKIAHAVSHFCFLDSANRVAQAILDLKK